MRIEGGFVILPGSENWWSTMIAGDELNKLFPDQDAHNFKYAVEYNDAGPLSEGVSIIDFKLLKQGEHDAESWIWELRLGDGTKWRAEGSCDYTGWDCQSHLDWEQL